MTATIERKELVLRNPSLAPLSPAQLRQHCPAVFATTARDDVSQRYGFASTATVLQALEKEGFVPVEARSHLRRDRNNMVYTKHMLRLRRVGDVAKLVTLDNTVPQVVLLNSHDRSSMFKLYAGMFRMVCSNGLIVSTRDVIEPITVRHTNRVVDDVMANVHRIAADAAKVSGLIDRMIHTAMPERAQQAFARKALELRNGNNGARGSVEASALLVPRRVEDGKNTVWHVYNRVQENMIKGGVASVTAAGRNTHTREVVALHSDVQINAGLWELAMAAIDKAKRK